MVAVDVQRQWVAVLAQRIRQVVQSVATEHRAAWGVNLSSVQANGTGAKVGERVGRLGKFTRYEIKFLVTVRRRATCAAVGDEGTQDRCGARLALLVPEHETRVGLMAGAAVPRVAGN